MPAATTSSDLLDEAWRLDPSVALRPERFGALAYHFGTRKLSFLKTPELVYIVHSQQHDSVQQTHKTALIQTGHRPA